MVRRNGLILTAAVMAATTILTACGGANTGSETSAKPISRAENQDERIVVAMVSDITSMDPVKQNDSTSAVFLSHVYNRLMKINNDGELVPDLAESYEIENDGLDYVFHLKENACFSDGTPVTAEDVKFTYDRAKVSSLTQSGVAVVDEVIVEDEHTVRIRLSQVSAPFLSKVADTGLSILSKDHMEALEAEGERYGEIDNILGSGPFIPSEWVPNNRYTLVRNENYWGEMPIGETIEVRVIPDENGRVFAFEAGEVDIVWDVDAALCGKIESNPEYELLSQPSTSIEFLGMNMENGPLSDLRVRQAINMAVDQQELIDVIMEGQGTAANSYINAMIPGWTGEVTAYEYDVEGAKKLLAEAGYSEGFDCTLVTNGGNRTRVAMLIQNQLAEVGINVTVETQDKGAMMDMMANGEADMYIYGGNNTSLDPDASVYTLLHSDNRGVSGNYTQIQDSELDEMIEDARTELNRDKRMELYKDIQFQLKEINPWVPLYYENQNVAVSSNLEGFELHNGGMHWLGDAHYKK